MTAVNQMSPDDLRAERQAKPTALYQARMPPRDIDATSARVQEINAELKRRGKKPF